MRQGLKTLPYIAPAECLRLPANYGVGSSDRVASGFSRKDACGVRMCKFGGSHILPPKGGSHASAFAHSLDPADRVVGGFRPAHRYGTLIVSSSRFASADAGSSARARWSSVRAAAELRCAR